MRGHPQQRGPRGRPATHKYGEPFQSLIRCLPRLCATPAGDTGHAEGKLYSVNVPLQEGMDDESYKYVYEPVMQKVGEVGGGEGEGVRMYKSEKGRR